MLQELIGSTVRVVKHEHGLMIRMHGILCFGNGAYYMLLEQGYIEFQASQVAEIISLSVTTIKLN